MDAELWTDDAAIDAWLTWLKNRNRSTRTIETYTLAIERLRDFLREDGVALLDADEEQLQLFCGLWLHRKGVLARSRVPYISAVRGFFAYAKSRKMIQRDPAERVEHPATGHTLPNTISLENAERLMWAPDMATFIGIRDAAMLAIMIGCGLRVSGLVGLNEGDLLPTTIDKQPRMLLRTTEKGEKQRLVPVPREAEMLLRVYLAHEELAEVDRSIEVRHAKGTRPDKVLFVSVRSTRLTADLHRGEGRRLTRKAINDMIHRYGRRLDIPTQQLHPHAFRHLFGTELAEDNVAMDTRQDLMGHADPKSQNVYVHLAQRRKMKVVDDHAPLAKMRTPVSELLRRLPPG